MAFNRTNHPLNQFSRLGFATKWMLPNRYALAVFE
jgi:hypothetical protein